jgi:adenylate kinase family enzyme
MAATTPDQKGAPAPANPEASVASDIGMSAQQSTTDIDATPNRILNANAKSFVPRLETANTPSGNSPTKTKGKGNKNNNGGGNSNREAANANATAAVAAQLQQQVSGNMPPPLGGFVQPQFAPQHMYAPPIAPLTALAASGMGAFAGFNPMLMSPLVVAALAASGRGVPQSPFAMPGHGNMSAGPGSPMMAPPSSSVVPVNVGNASLQALRAAGPARFACVLLVGMPRVGKTTIGRGLIAQLEDDNLPWAFFSGGDYLRETSTRPAPWDTTKDIYDALSKKIDDLQMKAASSDKGQHIKGIIIDKQCRGTEELYYLTALLRSKGLHLNGVVGLVADDDQKLMDRLGETDPAFREKCKFHRVIQTRIREVSKTAGLWHPVDALEKQEEVVRRVRSMVLGCSSQVPHKQLSPQSYHDSLSTMVDNYETYANTMGELVRLTRMLKSQFPGTTQFTPLPQQLLQKKSAFKEYAIRRRTDGTKYVLLYDGSNLYLIPRHMRCVFHLKNEAWLGIPLNNVAKFVIDGDLVRLSKERGKEKFLVQDVICWHEKGNATANQVARMSWKERQERLKVNICGENSAFYSNCDVVIAHQTFVEFKNAGELFEPCDYATDGFVFQPMQKRDDPVYFWRTPENVMVDFRLGTATPTGEGSKKYQLQVFDQKQAKFVEYGDDTVTINENRQFVVEGALVVCTLKPEETEKKGEGRDWTYIRTRTDISTAAFKTYVDDLLTNCLIPKAAVLAFLGVDPTQPRPAAATADGSTPPATSIAPLGTASSRDAHFGGAVQQQQQQSRGAFGSALSAADAARLQTGVQPLGATPNGSNTFASLEAVVKGNVHSAAPRVNNRRDEAGGSAAAGAGGDDRRNARRDPRDAREPRDAQQGGGAMRGERNMDQANGNVRRDRGPSKRQCADCGAFAEGEPDVGNHMFYCFACWQVFESKDSNRNLQQQRGPRQQQQGGADRQQGRRNNNERTERPERTDRNERRPPRDAAQQGGAQDEAQRRPREQQQPSPAR